MTLKFHDHLDHSKSVYIEATIIESVVPFGSGSAIYTETSVIGVAETPDEVQRIREQG